MNISPLRFTLGVSLTLACSSAAMAQDYVQSPRTYYLHPPSSYQDGCWGPCACVLSAREDMLGSFTLDLITVGDATDFYSITNASWRVPEFARQPFNTAISGSGTFAAGQSPWNTNQHVSLALTLTPTPPQWSGVQQFETTGTSFQRTTPPPVIDVEVANSTTGCPGIRLRIVASWFKSDFDASGTITTADIFAFLNAWLAASPTADFDNSGTLSSQDIFDFLNAWLAGC